MGYNSNLVSTFLFIATLCVLLPQASAFGAGDIPDFAYLNGQSPSVVTGVILFVSSCRELKQTRLSVMVTHSSHTLTFVLMHVQAISKMCSLSC